MKKIKSLFLKYKTMVLYIIFGGLTTLVNILVYFAAKNLLEASTGVSNVAAWLLSVIFAFVTNKCFVFCNTENSKKEIFVQLSEFFGARFFSGLLDTLIVVVFVDSFLFAELPVKIISNILVIIINYIASKFIIFKKK